MSMIRWGIAGLGRIANTVASDFLHVPGGEVVAVGSRDVSKAQAFAQKHGIKRAHGSYRELIEDDLDIIYIATPHPMHRDIALAAIAAGKGVLVEKSFSATLDGTRDIVDAARSAGVFCMEGMWTRFQPAIIAAHEVIAWGRIGDVLGIQGDLAAYRAFDPHDRLFSPTLGGGATLDLGVYVLNFAHDFLGAPQKVRASGRRYPNGVDAGASVTMGYAFGASASLTYALDTYGPGRMVIFGTKGWIEVEPRFHHPRRISVHRSGLSPRVIEAPVTGLGYSHELNAVTEAIQRGHTESTIMPLSATIEVAALVDDVCVQLGVHYEEAHVEL